MKCAFVIQTITLENWSAFRWPLLYMLLYPGRHLATYIHRKALSSHHTTVCL